MLLLLISLLKYSLFFIQNKAVKTKVLWENADIESSLIDELPS